MADYFELKKILGSDYEQYIDETNQSWINSDTKVVFLADYLLGMISRNGWTFTDRVLKPLNIFDIGRTSPIVPVMELDDFEYQFVLWQLSDGSRLRLAGNQDANKVIIAK